MPREAQRPPPRIRRAEKVERAMNEMKRGELKSGRSGKTVTAASRRS
jgi:hypothetical protein